VYTASHYHATRRLPKSCSICRLSIQIASGCGPRCTRLESRLPRPMSGSARTVSAVAKVTSLRNRQDRISTGPTSRRLSDAFDWATVYNRLDCDKRRRLFELELIAVWRVVINGACSRNRGRRRRVSLEGWWSGRYTRRRWLSALHRRWWSLGVLSMSNSVASCDDEATANDACWRRASDWVRFNGSPASHTTPCRDAAWRAARINDGGTRSPQLMESTTTKRFS